MIKQLNEMEFGELIEHVEKSIKALRRRAYAEGYGQGKFDAEMDGWFEIGETTETPQQARDRIVEQAKNDLEELTKYEGNTLGGLSGISYKAYVVVEKFIVNKEKGVVVCLLKGASSHDLKSKGIAKAHPDDCFNVHIGKAIALRRALGLEVPDEYLNAPQPTEVREGDVVKSTREWPIALNGPYYKGDLFEVRTDHIGEKYACASDSSIAENCVIIDDSREVNK